MKKHKTLLRIVIPVLIVAAIGALWLVKNNQRAQSAESQLAAAGDNPAFVLEDTAFNMESYLAHGLPIVLDFGAEDCVPCQQMRPALEKAHKEYLGRGLIKFFDVWKKPELAGDYPIMVVPSQVILNADGTPYQPGEKAQSAGLQFEQYNHRDTGQHALTMHIGKLDEAQFRLIFEDMGVQTHD